MTQTDAEILANATENARKVRVQDDQLDILRTKVSDLQSENSKLSAAHRDLKLLHERTVAERDALGQWRSERNDAMQKIASLNTEVARLKDELARAKASSNDPTVLAKIEAAKQFADALTVFTAKFGER